jgi:hypothetical protein
MGTGDKAGVSAIASTTTIPACAAEECCASRAAGTAGTSSPSWGEVVLDGAACHDYCTTSEEKAAASSSSAAAAHTPDTPNAACAGRHTNSSLAPITAGASVSGAHRLRGADTFRPRVSAGSAITAAPSGAADTRPEITAAVAAGATDAARPADGWIPGHVRVSEYDGPASNVRPTSGAGAPRTRRSARATAAGVFLGCPEATEAAGTTGSTVADIDCVPRRAAGLIVGCIEPRPTMAAIAAGTADTGSR